jgi:hypothetical protein
MQGNSETSSVGKACRVRRTPRWMSLFPPSSLPLQGWATRPRGEFHLNPSPGTEPLGRLDTQRATTARARERPDPRWARPSRSSSLARPTTGLLTRGAEVEFDQRAAGVRLDVGELRTERDEQLVLVVGQGGRQTSGRSCASRAPRRDALPRCGSRLTGSAIPDASSTRAWGSR